MHDAYSDEDSHLDPRNGSSRRAPKRGAAKTKAKLTPKLREPLSNSTLDTMLDEGEVGGGSKHSLAHELAAALMPQPSAGSKLLAEELGLEFEEGAEGIDEPVEAGVHHQDEDEEGDTENPMTPIDALQDGGQPVAVVEEPDQRSWDPLADLSRDMQTMDTFLSHLRRLDGEYTSTPEPPLEKAASQLIRRLNDTIREREDQVRQLLELEREFRRMSTEVGGNDVLGSLEELEAVDGLVDERQPSRSRSVGHSRLPSLTEADEDEWENSSSILPPRNGHDNDDALLSPISPSFPKMGVATPSSTIPHVAQFRSETKSLARNLTALSEQTQVNGAATADAGRKIRALKNKLGGWQAEWESAERSREQIDRWERSGELTKRANGRKLVEEQMKGFKLSLEQAASKTNSIMAVK